MFYRRKLILGLLQMFGDRLSQLKLYKLLLLVTKQQTKADYDFVPYQYGCYSFSLRADIDVMCKRNMLKEEEKTIVKLDKKNYVELLKEEDKKLLARLHARFANSSNDDIIRYTYVQYPYTAINSLIADRVLNKQELGQVQSERFSSEKTILFTIGYEGSSLEAYLNRLIQNDVKVLVDVRNNPLSMKFGFSKTLLKRFCEKLKIEYVHIPEVGIKSDQRQELKTQHDYDALFAKYKVTTLSTTRTYQQTILALLKEKQRIALTCFEADICQCHRKHLAEAITRLPGWDYELKHI